MSVHVPRLFLAIVVVGSLGVPHLGAQRGPIMQDPQTMPLWPGQAPGALGTADEDIPTLTAYMPPNTTGPVT